MMMMMMMMTMTMTMTMMMMMMMMKQFSERKHNQSNEDISINEEHANARKGWHN